jgi:hypothetical protein
MSYIGFEPIVQTTSTATQQFSGDGTTLQFNLQQGISKASDIIVSVGNTLQIPGTDYYVTSTALIFNAGKAPTAGTNNVTVTFIAGGLATINITANAYPIGNTVAPSIYATTSSATGIYWPSTTSMAFTTSGNTRVTVSDAAAGVATSTTTGALRVTGGAGVSGTLYANVIQISSGATSNSTVTGALVVSGGAGISGALNVGGTVTVSGGLTVAGSFNTTSTNSLTVNTPFVFLANTNVGDAIDQGVVGTYNDGVTQRYTGFYRAQSDGRWKLFTNLTNQPTTLVDSANVSFRYADLWMGNANVTSTVSSTTSQTGALTVWGGIGARGQIYINSLNNAIAIGNGGTAGVGNIGASGAGFGTAFLQATSAQYADVAEKYTADAEYEPGTVLDFGGAEEVTLATTDMSARIAGVVSTRPAYIMNDGIKGDFIVTVALLGRVPCRVRGPITKGDMLVSTGNGFARAEANPRMGSVIGKALEDFSDNEGTIEVVVGRV